MRLGGLTQGINKGQVEFLQHEPKQALTQFDDLRLDVSHGEKASKSQHCVNFALDDGFFLTAVFPAFLTKRWPAAKKKASAAVEKKSKRWCQRNLLFCFVLYLRFHINMS